MLRKRRLNRMISISLSLLMLLLLLYNPVVFAEGSMSEEPAAEQSGPAGTDLSAKGIPGESISSPGDDFSEPGTAQFDSTDSESVQEETSGQVGGSVTEPPGQQPDYQNTTFAGEAGQPVNETSDDSSATDGGVQTDMQSDSESTSNDTGMEGQDSQNPDGSNDSDNADQANQNQGQTETGEVETDTPANDETGALLEESPDQVSGIQEQVVDPEVPTPPLLKQVNISASIEDSSVTIAAACRNVASEDSTWQLRLISRTLKGAAGDDLSADIIIEGLPEGLTWTAQNAGENNILITVSGPANNMVLEPAAISIIIKGSAVNETEAGDSDALRVNLNMNGPSPDAIAVDPEGSTLYILIREKQKVLVVDIASDTVRSVISGGDINGFGGQEANDMIIAQGLLALIK